MDREPDELQHLGLIGISGEACKLLLSHRRIFSQIAAALVLPLALISLAHLHISHLLFSTIGRDDAALDAAPDGSPAESRILSRLLDEFAAVLLFKAAYLVAVLVFSLLSTAAVVYTVASAYTAKDLSFRKVLAVVPKVWKRLIVTFLWAFLLLASYNILAAFIILIAVLLFGPGGAGAAAVSLVVAAYAAGLVWISVVWHVARVVSVLEDAGGIDAMRKSRLLIRGKVWAAALVFVVLSFAFAGVEVGYRKLVVEGGGAAAGLAVRIGCAALMLAMLALLILLGLVAQTVVYFVCKAYHHESIDKSSLSDHLEEYLGEYAPLKGKDVQLQQFDL